MLSRNPPRHALSREVDSTAIIALVARSSFLSGSINPGPFTRAKQFVNALANPGQRARQTKSGGIDIDPLLERFRTGIVRAFTPLRPTPTTSTIPCSWRWFSTSSSQFNCTCVCFDRTTLPRSAVSRALAPTRRHEGGSIHAMSWSSCPRNFALQHLGLTFGTLSHVRR